MSHFSKDLLWHAPGSRVAENVLLEAAFMRGLPAEAPLRHHLNPAVPCPFRNRLRYHPEEMAVVLEARPQRQVYVRLREGKAWAYSGSWAAKPDNCSSAPPTKPELMRGVQPRCTPAEDAIASREAADLAQSADRSARLGAARRG
jgi:hypothetical protein